jgi:hypothetical protein
LKIAFDENVPAAMVRVFAILAKERQLKWLASGLKVESAKDYTPRRGDPDFKRRNDVPWIKRFADAGGRVIISGDAAMKNQPHERLALVEQGLVTIFFDRSWCNLQFFRKCSILLHWWPVVVATAKTAKKGTFWQIPATYGDGTTLRQVPNGDAQLEKIDRQLAQRDSVRAERARKRAHIQPRFDFEGEQK